MDLFQLATNDQSISYLSYIFGAVGSALPAGGGGPTFFPAMFKVFNSVMLTVGAFVVAYTTIIGTMATAHDGEFLGKKMNSLWVPLRTVMGIVGLVPMGSGYCAIQVVMMWFIVQGIAAADSLWLTVVNVAEGNVVESVEGVLQANASVGTNLTMPLIMSKIYLNSVCQKAYATYHAYNPLLYGNVSGEANPQWISSNDGWNGYVFSGTTDTVRSDGTTNYYCGALQLTQATGDDQQNQMAYNAQVAAFQQIVPTLSDVAQQTVTTLLGYCPQGGQNLDACTTDSWPDATTLKNQLLNSLGGINFITSAVNQYSAYMDNVLQSSYSSISSSSDLVAKGWIFAGGYYNDISSKVGSATNNQQQASSGTLKAVAPYDCSKSNWPTTPSNFSGSLISSFYTSANQVVGLLADNNVSGSTATSSQCGGGSGTPSTDQTSTVDQASQITNAGFSTSATVSNSDPITIAAGVGAGLLLVAQIVFAIYIAVGIAVAAVSGIMTSVQPGGVIANFIYNFLSPFTLFVLGLMVTYGAIFAVYLPIIPLILFTAAAIGWLIAVIETMVAAPIVALGILYPEAQHDVLGKAEPALMLLANIFLRPSLMIFGFVGGILMVRVVVTFINSVYWSAFSAASWVSGPLGWFLMIGAYIALFVSVVNKAFSLIHILPDRVLRWIGGGESFAGSDGSDMLNEAKGKISSGAETASSGMQSSGGRAAQKAGAVNEAANKEKTKAAYNEYKAKKDDDTKFS